MIVITFIICIITIIAIIIIGDKQQIAHAAARQNSAIPNNNYNPSNKQPPQQSRKQEQLNNYANSNREDNLQQEQRLPEREQAHLQMYGYGQQLNPVKNQQSPVNKQLSNSNRLSPKKANANEFQLVSQIPDQNIGFDDEIRIEQAYGNAEDNYGQDFNSQNNDGNVDYPEEIQFEVHADQVQNHEVNIPYEDYQEHEQYNN